MYCLDVKAVVFLGMITIWCVAALIFLLDRKLYSKARRIHYISLLFLFVWCLFALILGGLLERMFAGLTLGGMTAMEALVRRRRKLEQRMPLEQQ